MAALLFIFTLLTGCGFTTPEKTESTPPDHSAWDQLLQKHVDAAGMVDYQGFQSDQALLGVYLQDISTHPPDKGRWSREEQLAYWINTYNAFTIQLVLQHYPVESIKDIGPLIQIPFVFSPWDIRFIEIGGNKMDLNNIEHNILRKEFDEPRIHFAINCASISCPRLRQEAYVAENLDVQLTEQAKAFLSDPGKNNLSQKEIQLSKIFSWFQNDFTKKGSLIDFINQYSRVNVHLDAEVEFLPYDWSLNEQ